jgi:hypothetical protein
MKAPQLELYDECDDYRIVHAYFPGDTPGDICYRYSVVWSSDTRRLSHCGWERAWSCDHDWDDIGTPPPPVLTAWATVQRRAETWARTGADPGDARRQSLSRGTWRAA